VDKVQDRCHVPRMSRSKKKDIQKGKESDKERGKTMRKLK
jgi:hypothetical protein